MGSWRPLIWAKRERPRLAGLQVPCRSTTSLRGGWRGFANHPRTDELVPVGPGYWFTSDLNSTPGGVFRRAIGVSLRQESCSSGTDQEIGARWHSARSLKTVAASSVVGLTRELTAAKKTDGSLGHEPSVGQRWRGLGRGWVDTPTIIELITRGPFRGDPRAPRNEQSCFSVASERCYRLGTDSNEQYSTSGAVEFRELDGSGRPLPHCCGSQPDSRDEPSNGFDWPPPASAASLHVVQPIERGSPDHLGRDYRQERQREPERA